VNFLPDLPCLHGTHLLLLLLLGHGDDRYTFPLWKKIVAGGISGCIGAAIASPTGAPPLVVVAAAAASHTDICKQNERLLKSGHVFGM
jgi:hypothetical protein